MQDYEAIRERIARWLNLPTHRTVEIGGELRTSKLNPVCFPDPLNNASHAWALQCALIEKLFDVRMFGLPNNGACDGYRAGLLTLDGRAYIANGKTPAEALVMAWAEAFPAEEGE